MSDDESVPVPEPALPARLVLAPIPASEPPPMSDGPWPWLDASPAASEPMPELVVLVPIAAGSAAPAALAPGVQLELEAGDALPTESLVD